MWFLTSLMLKTVGKYRYMANKKGAYSYILGPTKLEKEKKPAVTNLGVYSMDKIVLDGSPFPHSSPPTGPYFDPANTRNVTIISDGRAVLNCRVYNIGNRTVRLIKMELEFIINKRHEQVGKKA